VYRDWDKPGKALEYLQKSLKLFEELNDAENIAGIMKNIKKIPHQFIALKISRKKTITVL